MGFPSYRRDSVEELIERTAPPLRPLLAAARRRVLQAVPGATERLRAGWGLLGYDCPRYFAYLVPMPDHLRLGFERGVLLHDPAGLLRGTGTQVRHVELRTPADLRHPALTALLREAAASRGWVAPPRRTCRR